MENNGYNGYANYETWLFCVNTDNDQSIYNYFQSVAQEAAGGGTDRAHQLAQIADTAKEWAEDQRDAAADKLGHGVMTDLINAALDRIDWQEVAENILSE